MVNYLVIPTLLGIIVLIIALQIHHFGVVVRVRWGMIIFMNALKSYQLYHVGGLFILSSLVITFNTDFI